MIYKGGNKKNLRDDPSKNGGYKGKVWLSVFHCCRLQVPFRVGFDVCWPVIVLFGKLNVVLDTEVGGWIINLGCDLVL